MAALDRAGRFAHFTNDREHRLLKEAELPTGVGGGTQIRESHADITQLVIQKLQHCRIAGTARVRNDQSRRVVIRLRVIGVAVEQRERHIQFRRLRLRRDRGMMNHKIDGVFQGVVTGKIGDLSHRHP